ncbi:MAG TPA: LysE family translocator [Candidatus Eisenbacteria bacterium]|nr:LysE family translocator [Candidatus Eisenbacteria bacterium]
MFLAFLGIAALVIATPGPDTALTIRNSMFGGRRAGTFTALGVASGQLVWVAATGAGLVAVLLASEPVFRFIKLLGAGYLVYLGIRSLYAAVRGTPASPGGATAAGPKRTISGSSAFRQGVINNLANPKMAVFFASVLPQFVPKGEGILPALALLGLVFAGMTLAWLALYAAVTARVGAFARGSRLTRLLEGMAGVALLGLGIRVATEER